MTLEEKQEAMRMRGTVYDGRHRNKQKVPTMDTEIEYWEAELQRAGLTMKRGLNRHLYYWGNTKIIDEIGSRLAFDKEQQRTAKRRGAE